MTKLGLCLFALTLSLQAGAQATGNDAWNGSIDPSSSGFNAYFSHPKRKARSNQDEGFASKGGAAIPEGQQEIIAAQERGKGLNFVEVQDAEVIRILPDDTQGRRHQKWMVQLANGSNLLAVYNSDMSERIPLKEGDVVSMGGQYIWDRGGGLIHWLHEDPRNRRPDGYVELNGVRYGVVESNR